MEEDKRSEEITLRARTKRARRIFSLRLSEPACQKRSCILQSVQRTTYYRQTARVFQRPRRKKNALTIASDEKAIMIAINTPCGPARKWMASV